MQPIYRRKWEVAVCDFEWGRKKVDESARSCSGSPKQGTQKSKNNEREARPKHQGIGIQTPSSIKIKYEKSEN